MPAITWALGKLGLSLADGKSLMPIAAFIAACVAAVGLAAYIAHSLTATGYAKAEAECKADKATASLAASEHQTALREASREVIIKHTAAVANIAAAAVNEKQEVTDYVEKNPAPDSCALTPVGLRIFNRALSDNRATSVPGGSAAALDDRFSLTNFAISAAGRSGYPPAQPNGLKESLRGPLEVSPGAIGSSQAVPAESRASIGTR